MSSKLSSVYTRALDAMECKGLKDCGWAPGKNLLEVRGTGAWAPWHRLTVESPVLKALSTVISVLGCDWRQGFPTLGPKDPWADPGIDHYMPGPEIPTRTTRPVPVPQHPWVWVMDSYRHTEISVNGGLWGGTSLELRRGLLAC